MTPEPKIASPSPRRVGADQLFVDHRAVGEDGRPVGIIHIHDLLRAGVA
jgi:hypothetical protein